MWIFPLLAILSVIIRDNTMKINNEKNTINYMNLHGFSCNDIDENLPIWKQNWIK